MNELNGMNGMNGMNIGISWLYRQPSLKLAFERNECRRRKKIKCLL
jgi:hypothetical protein